ncbi:MAG TPA: trypsin-like peptidase domain-containing protein [Gemmatimonadaceae bacterium]|nr:trypsin-like peptidase domain-containing protein [Gemmatimonadaceae bacterium]
MICKISSRALARRGGRASLTTALVVAYALLNAGAACAQRTTKDTTSNAQASAVHSDTSTGEVESFTPLPAIHSRFAEIAKRVTPAVVSISTEFSPEVAARMEGGEQQIPPGFLPPGFLPPGAQQQPQQENPVRATGSGFLISSDGYIMTNNHMVDGASKVRVTLLDHRIFTAKIIGHDPSTDVALIKIEGSNFPTVQLGNDSTVQVGDPVIAIGNPLGLDFTVTSGIISAKGRADQLTNLFNAKYAVVDFLQTDAVINPGNSGGPLVDMQGKVIGMNTAIASPTGVYAGYGFAIPISIARNVTNDLKQFGEVHRGILGVSIQNVGPADAQAAGLDKITGAMVGGFTSDTSPAKKAGLEPGDIILAVDGRPVTRVSELQGMMLAYKPGETVTLDVMRYGKRRSFKVTLGALPNESTLAEAGNTSGGAKSPTQVLGISVTSVTPTIAQQLRLPSGITGLAVADVDPNGLAAGQLAPRDIIEATLGGGSRQPVRTVEDLRKAIEAAKGGVLSLLVYTPQLQGTRVVNIEIGKGG